MSGEIKHREGYMCNANKLFISGRGLQCGSCGAVSWEDEMKPKEKKEYLKSIKGW